MIPPDEETKSTDKATFERAKRDIATVILTNNYSTHLLLITCSGNLALMTLKSILAFLQLIEGIYRTMNDISSPR